MFCFRRFARAINSGFKKLIEHIVFVGGNNELLDRQAHHAGDVAGQHVTKIAGWYGERNFFVVRFGDGEIAFEVVNHLCHDPAPIDRIDRADFIIGFKFEIVGNGFDDILAIIKHAFHGDVDDIFVLQGKHLRRLEWRHFAVRREHKNAHACFALHRVFGAGAGVTGSCAKDINFRIAFA